MVNSVPIKPKTPRDLVPSSCDLCNAKTQLDYVSIEEILDDGSMRKYLGYVCDACAEELKDDLVNKFMNGDNGSPF